MFQEVKVTRINVIDPSKLIRQHLVAEYREITRLPGNLEKSLKRKKPFSVDEIPQNYTLGKGHVKFFYNKMLFLQKRFEMLVKEMIYRGYSPKFTDITIFERCPDGFFRDYVPTEEAVNINNIRINERIDASKKEVKNV